MNKVEESSGQNLARVEVFALIDVGKKNGNATVQCISVGLTQRLGVSLSRA